ncbi:hypothetical protein AVEN_249517-1 [Araneus ventricosus]|uniref:DUF4817 domain-containing protein n=1 Tax=Araneus ventricosus TaxID=182803 RepID=A0A4Y2HMQ8_ARAVE|nr:hypothetical protein AVEN_249517-1 [Araneus ventricosus]
MSEGESSSPSSLPPPRGISLLHPSVGDEDAVERRPSDDLHLFLPGRGRKQIPSSSVEDVAISVVEASSQWPHYSVSVPVVSRVLDMPYSAVRKILRRILNFYPYKIKPIAGQGLRGQRYRDMLRDFVIPQLQQRGCLQNIIFMPDGTPHHIDCRVSSCHQLLRQHFTDARVISRHFPTPWPPLSVDITPCDFWLRGFLKDNIYRKRPASVPDLKDSVRLHVLDIPADSLLSAVENMVLRLEHIVEHEGGTH